MRRCTTGAKIWVFKTIFILVAIIFSVTPTMASGLSDTGQYNKNEKSRSILDDVDKVWDIQYRSSRNGHLNFGFIQLQKNSPTRAGILATTQGHHACPKIYLDIYLDIYNEKTGLWEQSKYWEYSATYSQHLTKELEVIVPSGNYFSIRGYHKCRHDNVIESGETMTDGLYIGITDKPIFENKNHN